MGNEEHSVKLIAYLVEKVTKGCRKQLKGYVTDVKNQIEGHKKYVEVRIEDLESLVRICRNLQKDWPAIQRMIIENNENKKILHEMLEVHNQIKDELMDMKLLSIDIKQFIEVKK